MLWTYHLFPPPLGGLADAWGFELLKFFPTYIMSKDWVLKHTLHCTLINVSTVGVKVAHGIIATVVIEICLRIHILLYCTVLHWNSVSNYPVSLSRRANARNVRSYYPYWQLVHRPFYISIIMFGDFTYICNLWIYSWKKYLVDRKFYLHGFFLLLKLKEVTSTQESVLENTQL